MRVARLLVLMLPILLLAPSSLATIVEPVSDDGVLRIDAVISCGPFEMISFINIGSSSTFNEVSLSDGEGCLTFRCPLFLESYETFSIYSAETWFSYGDEGCLIGSPMISRTGSFILADTGDEVSLMVDGLVVDVLVYGAGDASIHGWYGPSVEKIQKGEMATRISMEDTDSALDWTISVPGRSSFQPTEFYAGVEPFTYPEEGYDRIIRELCLVEESISLAVYELDNITVMAHLMRLAQEGKETRVLLEGSPVGGLSDEQIGWTRTMADAGCDVRFIRSDDGFKRYDYLHCKYGVMDECRTLVASENWKDSSFLSNRGWGAIVQSKEMAGFMLSMFDGDFNESVPDILRFQERYPFSEPLPLPDVNGSLPSSVEIAIYPGRVTPVICPDYGLESVMNMIASAERSVFVQQFYSESSWLREETPLTMMMDAAVRGADVRLMLDSSWFSEGKDNALIMEEMSSSGIVECRSPIEGSEFQVLHNKGVICDDSVLISSMNWVSASFLQNREVGVIIDSREVASFFRERFLVDWGLDPTPPETTIALLTSQPKIGSPIALKAELIHADSPITNYSWDIDGDGDYDRFGESISFILDETALTITLRVNDSDGLENLTVIEVTGILQDDEQGMPWALVPLSASVITTVTILLLRSRRAQCLK